MKASNCGTFATLWRWPKNFTSDARLHLSQPPLSQQILKLEQMLGHPLLTRTSRSVSLTAAGEAFLQSARRTLRNVQRDIEETRIIGRGEVGSLHVGFVGSAMLAGLSGIFRAYREAYPRVRLACRRDSVSRCGARTLLLRAVSRLIVTPRD